jgi:hypothetical protein
VLSHHPSGRRLWTVPRPRRRRVGDRREQRGRLWIAAVIKPQRHDVIDDRHVGARRTVLHHQLRHPSRVGLQQVTALHDLDHR